MFFEEDFFKAEYRNGFYVSEAMKRAWAAQLEVLGEIARICEKYNIQYFADWGTMLGTVRHHGFVPWDDDIDIAMKRKDYWKFLQVARKELPAGFELLSVYNTDNYDNMLARVLNTDHVCLTKEHLEKYHGCPYMMGIDIFPLDYIAKDEEKCQIQRELMENVRQIITLVGAEAIGGGELLGILEQLQEICGFEVVDNIPIKRQLYMLADRLCGMYTEEDGDELTSMWDLIDGWKDYRIPRKYYDDVIWMPFENTTLPIPDGYDFILTVKYKNYHKLVRGGGSHNYPSFGNQEALLRKQAADIKEQLPTVVAKDLMECNFDLTRTIPIGNCSFRAIREQQDYYVDKSLLIKELLDTPHKVTFLNGTKKCGRKLLINMLSEYCDVACDKEGTLLPNEHLFHGLEIEQTALYSRYSQKYVGFNIFWDTFQAYEAKDYNEFCQGINRYINDIFIWSAYMLLKEGLKPEQKEQFQIILDTAETNDTDGRKEIDFGKFSLFRDCLVQFYERKMVVMMDSYDAVLKNAAAHGFYEEAKRDLETIFKILITENSHLEFAVIFGNEFPEKESLFAGVDDIREITQKDKVHWDYMYFSEEEAEKMLEFYELQEYQPVLKEYFALESPFGDTVYHPWNVLNFVQSFGRGAREVINYLDYA